MDRDTSSAMETIVQHLTGDDPELDAAFHRAMDGSAMKEAFLRRLSGQGEPNLIQILLERFLNEIMLSQRDNHLNARSHQRTQERSGYANGFKHKRLDTTAGTLHLNVPKTAQRGVFSKETFYPDCIEKGMRCERALLLVMAEMYVQGVSTRRVQNILKRMGVEGISSMQVSRATQMLDEELQKWRERQLGKMKYLQIDARYEKVRLDGVVRNVAVLTAVGVDEAGRRCVLGVSVKASEAEVHWRDFLDSLVARGLSGVEFIVSDDHAGLKVARRAVFPGATWQRCQFHLARNASKRGPTAKIRDRIGEELRAVWNAASAEAAQSVLNDLTASYRERYPEFAEWLEDNVPEGFAVFALPPTHRRSMRTSNPIERAIQQELKRRTAIVRVFPNTASLLRLASAILIQIDEQWATGKTYISWGAQND